MIGGKRHRLKLQKPVTSKDADGGQTVTWQDVETIWGSIAPPRRTFVASSSIAAPRGGESYKFGQLVNEITHQCEIRYRSDISTKWRIVFDGRTFNIHSFVDPTERKNELVLALVEGVAT